MVYASLSNYKRDSGPHRLQSGPSHTSDDLNLVEKYLVVSSGYVDPLGNTVSFYGVNNTGETLVLLLLVPLIRVSI